MKQLILITLLLTVQNISAQDFRFGKVSKEELLETSHPTFSEADAVVLYRHQQVYFEYMQNVGFIQINEVFERIKIYNKEGFDQATKFIRFYNNSEGSRTNNEKIANLKGVTYNLEGSKIIEDKLKKEGIFEEETNKFWKTTKFTMPNIKEGCIIEFTYRIESQNIGIDDIEFQNIIPINKIDFKLKTPEYFNYKKLLNPRASFIPTFTNTVENSSISITSKERSGVYVSKTNFQTSKINYLMNVMSASLNNIPPLIEENFIDNLNNYQSKLILELDFVKWPNEPIEYLSTTWEKVTKAIYKNEDFGNQLDKTGYYNKDIDVLLNGVNEPSKKIELIFDFVKSKVKWNGYYGYTADTGVSKAYKESTGNVADINLMLISMLRYSGLKANPVLLSTKANGIPLLPTRSGFNYVICAVETPNGQVLLDASQKFSTFNILPLNSLNWLGRLIRENESSDWIDLIPNTPSRESTLVTIELNDDLSVIGKVKNNYTDYLAMRLRNRFENFNSQQIIDFMEKKHQNLQVSGFKIENLSNVNMPITQSYEFNLNDAVEVIGDKVYFSPLMFLINSDNPFKEDSRNYPIDFVFPTSDKYIVNIKLPEGYNVESIPQSSKLRFKESEGEFTFVGSQNGNYLQFIISTDINRSLILADDYKVFKEFYQRVIEKQSEKVVLKKT